MPRSSPFTITLSFAEEAELRKQAAKYTVPYFQVQRAKMILYAAEGCTTTRSRRARTPAVSWFGSLDDLRTPQRLPA
jgi:hypothetical protein